MAIEDNPVLTQLQQHTKEVAIKFCLQEMFKQNSGEYIFVRRKKKPGISYYRMMLLFLSLFVL